MNRQRPLLLFLLVAYISSPALFEWVIDAHNGWYRPFILWALLVFITYILRRRDKTHDV